MVDEPTGNASNFPADLEGEVFDTAGVTAFSKLPTRVELIARLMGTLQAPVQNVALVLNGVSSKLVRTLAAVAEAKGK